MEPVRPDLKLPLSVFSQKHSQRQFCKVPKATCNADGMQYQGKTGNPSGGIPESRYRITFSAFGQWMKFLRLRQKPFLVITPGGGGLYGSNHLQSLFSRSSRLPKVAT
jgi:hypothetical protein